jgi:hypothetical protein
MSGQLNLPLQKQGLKALSFLFLHGIGTHSATGLRGDSDPGHCMKEKKNEGMLVCIVHGATMLISRRKKLNSVVRDFLRLEFFGKISESRSMSWGSSDWAR